MPYVRIGASGAFVNDKLYVFGGMADYEHMRNEIDVYTLNDNVWKTVVLINKVPFSPSLDSYACALNKN